MKYTSSWPEGRPWLKFVSSLPVRRRVGGRVRRVSTAAWLIVRARARLSRKETSPFISVSGDASTSVLANTAPFSPARELLTLLRFKALAFIVRDLRSFKFLLPILLLTPSLAQAQTTQAPSPDIQRQRIEQL